MDPGIKIPILISIFAMGTILICTMIIMQTLSHMSHFLEHVEKIVENESVIRVERYSRQAAKEMHAQKMEEERQRRSEALLSMPLMMDKSEDEK